MTQTSAPVRNLVVCCDGTGNMWGSSQDTNVVKLARFCVKDSEQIVYYDPGVGTASGFPAVGVIDNIAFRINLIVGLAMGGGIYQNIASAYAFLVNNYQPGDLIYLIGFSRGAFTARSVSGMVNLFGIVRPAGDVMIPTLLRIYFSDADPEKKDERNKSRKDNADDIRANFTDPVGHEARIYAIGVWDTVATVGGLRPRSISSDNSTANKRFDHVRHAVSEGEYRAKYEPRLYGGENRDEPGFDTDAEGRPEYRPSLKQLHFAGVHSDVGGSYAEAGLSDIPLLWMLEELEMLGLRLQPAGASELRPDASQCTHDQPMQGVFGPWWALTRLQRRQPPEPGSRHDSLKYRQEQPQDCPLFWKKLLRNPVFLIPAVAWVIVQLVLWWTLAGVSPADGTGALDLMARSLVAVTSGATGPSPYADHLELPSLLRGVACLVMIHLLCVGCVYATGRLRNVRPDDAAFHTRLSYGLWIALLVAAATAVVQIPLDMWYFNFQTTWRAVLVSAVSVIGWLSYAVLAGNFFLAIFRGRSPVRQGTFEEDARMPAASGPGHVV